MCIVKCLGVYYALQKTSAGGYLGSGTSFAEAIADCLNKIETEKSLDEMEMLYEADEIKEVESISELVAEAERRERKKCLDEMETLISEGEEAENVIKRWKMRIIDKPLRNGTASWRRL